MSGYLNHGPYGPERHRRGSGRHFVEVVTIAGVAFALAAAVLIVAVRFRPATYTLCQATGAAVLCVTAQTPPAMPQPVRLGGPSI